MNKTKNLLTKVLAIVLVCAIMITSMGAYSGETTNDDNAPVFVKKVSPSDVPYYNGFTTINIKVLQDISFQNKFSGTIDDVLDKASKAFRNRWDYLFDYSVYNIIDNTLENHDCPNGYDAYCTNNVCGTKCVNQDTFWANHHKNFYSIHEDIRQKGWIDNFDLQTTVTMDATCAIKGSVHEQSPYAGLGDLNGEHSTVIIGSNEIYNVRVLQHEISHNFGCFDRAKNQCLDEYGEEERCIMSGGFDRDDNYYHTSIWCYECEQDFNINKF